MAAHRLECGGERLDSARQCWLGDRVPFRTSFLRLSVIWTRISKSSPSLGAESFSTNRHRYSGFQHDAPALDSVFGESSILRHTHTHTHSAGPNGVMVLKTTSQHSMRASLAAVAPHPWPRGSMPSDCHRATRVDRPNRGVMRSLRTGPKFSILQIDSPLPSAQLLSP